MCNFWFPNNRTMATNGIPTQNQMPLCYYTLEGKRAHITDPKTTCGTFGGGCNTSPYTFDLVIFDTATSGNQ